METGLERIAAKARSEPNLRFTSICHHISKSLLWESLKHSSKNTAPGIDGIGVDQAEINFENWSAEMLQAIHNQGYKAPPTRRVWIPKPGKTEKRPISVPCIADRALQRSAATVLSAIWEQDFLSCSFGGRPGLSAHHALATLNEIISGKKVEWVYEADLKNFFGSLNQGWLLQFVQHRVGDPRMINLIRRWLKAGILEEGQLHINEVGTVQGGSISVLLSNLYLHYVLDLWFEKVVKPRLKGEAYLIRFIDDFVVCFQYRADAIRFQNVLHKRLDKFSLKIEPNKTRLVEFGRFAHRHTKRRGEKLETVYFLGFTHFCTRNFKGNFKVGRKTEKSRFRRSVEKLCTLMREIRHYSLKEQCGKINEVLRGHYNYYGIGGNVRALYRFERIIERYWRKMLNRRGGKAYITWEKFNEIKQRLPLQRPKLRLTFQGMQAIAVL